MPNLDEIREIGSLTVSVEREEQLEACLKAKHIQRIYLDEASFSEEEIRRFAKKIKERGIEAALRFRRIERRESPAFPGLRKMKKLLFFPPFCFGA